MPAITKPNLHFDATTYTGTGSALSVTNGGFQPDFVWMKSRTSGGSPYTNHTVIDSVRGAGTYGYKNLNPNLTDAEYDPISGNAAVTALNSSGFTLGGNANVNTNTMTAVAWQWKAGGAAVTNNDGTITSQVSANPTAGFSVVTFTAPGSGNFSAGHGLGVTPGMVITKVRGRSTSWITWHNRLNSGSPGTTYYIDLNLTNAQSSFASVWGSTGVTSSVIGMGIGASCAASDTIVAYCFAPVAGYSAFGSYTGNASTDGPFVYLGFRPRFVLFRSTSARNWVIRDTSRNTYNAVTNDLYPDSDSADYASGDAIDFLSNGFKLRATGATFNGSGETYIYAAFAEAPFKFSNGR